MQNIVEIEINASTQAVWAVLFEQFGDIGKWFTGIKGSRILPQAFSQDVPFSGRICDTSDMGELLERFTAVSIANKTFSYQAIPQKAPFFLKNIINHWAVIDNGNGKTLVRSTVNVTLMAPFNVLLGGAIKTKFNKVISGLLISLKEKIEHKTI